MAAPQGDGGRRGLWQRLFCKNRRFPPETKLPNAWLAISPLVVVFAMNKLFTSLIPAAFGPTNTVKLAGLADPIVTEVPKVIAIWAVEAALILGILTVIALAFGTMAAFRAGDKAAVAGSLLASMNTASEYGFGAVMRRCRAFSSSRSAARDSQSAGERGDHRHVASRHHGLGIGRSEHCAGGDGDEFLTAANAAGISPQVLHRVAAMASGGMDTLPHNGAVITLLAVTGLTHRQSYRDIFAITCIKTVAVFFVIAVFYVTHIV